MKVIMIVNLDDSFIPLDEDTITLGKGTIKYRDINRNPFEIIIEGLKLKPLPHNDFIAEAFAYQTEEEYKAYVSGWNDCVDEILGGEEE